MAHPANSMLTFLVAFSYECFVTREIDVSWAAGSSLLVTGFLVLWTIYASWESKNDSWTNRALSKMQDIPETLREVVHGHISCLFPSSSAVV